MQNRQTLQKEIILEVLGNLNHPTAEELLTAITKKHSVFSKATLYRNLGQFVEDGKVQKLCLENQTVRYELNTGFHYHLVCTECGRIDNLVLPKPLTLPSTLLGYDIESHDLILFGKCPHCK